MRSASELAGAQVVASWLVRPARLQTAAGVEQLLPDRRQLEPAGLLGVQAPVARVQLVKVLQVGGQRRLQLGGDARDAHRGGEVVAELVDDAQGVANGVVVLQGENVQHGLGGDVRVAVAVTPDPCAEGEGTGIQRQLEAEPGELVGERPERLRDGVAVERVEVVDRVAGLVDHLGTRDAQLVGLPQQVDQLLQPAPDAALGDAVGLAVTRAEGAVPLLEQRGRSAGSS